jgi:hypothetical protein
MGKHGIKCNVLIVLNSAVYVTLKTGQSKHGTPEQESNMTKSKKCPGLYFRFRKSLFPTTNGIGMTERISLLKSKSCKGGCEYCHTHIMSEWSESLECFDKLPVQGKPEDGDELKLVITEWSEDSLDFHFEIVGSANQYSNWRSRRARQ